MKFRLFDRISFSVGSVEAFGMVIGENVALLALPNVVVGGVNYSWEAIPRDAQLCTDKQLFSRPMLQTALFAAQAALEAPQELVVCINCDKSIRPGLRNCPNCGCPTSDD